MREINFDFQKYIIERQGRDSALARDGVSYAYPGDLKVRRTLNRITPVTLAVEAAVRLWRGVARGEILGTAVKVSPAQFPAIYQLVVDCADRLQIDLPQVYVAPEVESLSAHTFGTNDTAIIVLNGVLVDHLEPEELRFVIGHECGHIQNNHVVYMTALYYLMYSANQFVRWIVTPALMALQAWTRRAEITSDRAGLICAGELAPAVQALAKLALGSQRLADQLNVTEYLKQHEENRAGSGPVAELFMSHPYLPKRVEALRLFAQTHFFLRATRKEPREDEGRSLTWCDARVREHLSLFPGQQQEI